MMAFYFLVGLLLYAFPRVLEFLVAIVAIRLAYIYLWR